MPDGASRNMKLRMIAKGLRPCLVMLMLAGLVRPVVGQESKPQAKTEAGQALEKKAATEEDPHKPGTFMGRAIAPVMSYLGADWLLRETREQEEQPEQMLDALNLKPGQVVADVGAGVGYTSVRLARRVGPTGKVYATDIQPQMIRMLKANIRTMKLEKTIIPLLCTATETKLPDGEIDLIIMVDVYHECSSPVETLKGLKKALKPGGRLVLIEFRAEDPEVPIRPEHKMTLAQARREVEAQGFQFQKNDERLPWQHIIIFEKPVEPAKAETK